MRRVPVSRPLLLGGLVLLSSFLFSGCKLFDSPQNVFAPAGEVARDQKNLFFLTMWPALAILILVEGGILWICFKYRRKKGDTGLPAQVHGNNRLEITWTILPAILLAVFVPFVIGGIVKLGNTPKDAITVDVTGVQWQWQFTYPDINSGQPVELGFDEPLHIPVNKNIALRLHSDNVIHSFWVPRLAGKTDVIPGRTNTMWFRATETGQFSGQCAEFCGLDHANMRFCVIVDTQEDFDKWLAETIAGTAPPPPARVPGGPSCPQGAQSATTGPGG